jgi:large subunit ribosomal protein L10
MPTEAKRETVARLREEMSRGRAMIVSEYRGLTVREMSDIRATLRRQGITYRVVKNRLAKIAARDVVGDALEPLLQGPTAIAFGEDEAATAKAVLEALRPYRVVRITGAVLGRQTIDAESVARLAALPPRETLLAEVAGAIAAPLATVAGLFDAPARSIVGLVAALAEKRAATGEAAA